ncbi:Uncharacterised protein [Vibrio cholerae]|nr:Uncharacterised protein [Vibrio cholerae]
MTAKCVHFRPTDADKLSIWVTSTYRFDKAFA